MSRLNYMKFMMLWLTGAAFFVGGLIQATAGNEPVSGGIAAAAGLFILATLLLITFGESDGAECTGGHHFEEHRRPNDFDVEYFPSYVDGAEWWRIEQRVVYRCVHEGCSETKTKCEKVASTESGLDAMAAMKDNA